jgi:tetratricopeptide (TPR) repeat protein
MDCPRCGAAEVTTPACPRCGVIVAKARPRAARDERIGRWHAQPATTDTPQTESIPAESPGVSRWWYAVGVIALVLSFAIGRKSSRDRTRVADPVATTPPPMADVVAAPPPPASTLLPYSPPPSAAEIKAEVNGLSEADRLQAEALVRYLARGGAMAASDVSGAEQLFASHPGEPVLKDLLEAVLMNAAQNERSRRNYPAAAAHLRRAAAVNSMSARPLIVLVETLVEAGDWTGAEIAARAALAIDRRNTGMWQHLGYALLRLDRNREAAEVLRSALEIKDDTQTRALLARVEKGLDDEKGMAERQLSHFHVRYDGEAHEDVGREILRALERHYATLARALDHQPPNPIPVILFSRQGYFDASGAPAWSGGVFDGMDGRIRIPIGGLTSSLTPYMDATLIHELTHAFINDRSKGVAPREVHEGLAQYMEGKRSASDYSPRVLAGLADGRIGGVGGFYLAALSYVEHLIATRGMGGMNDLIRAMGETGDVDEAFKQVHGGSYNDSRKVWAQHLRQQYGS